MGRSGAQVPPFKQGLEVRQQLIGGELHVVPHFFSGAWKRKTVLLPLLLWLGLSDYKKLHSRANISEVQFSLKVDVATQLFSVFCRLHSHPLLPLYVVQKFILCCIPTSVRSKLKVEQFSLYLIAAGRIYLLLEQS